MEKLHPEEAKKIGIVILIACLLFIGVVLLRTLRTPEKSEPVKKETEIVRELLLPSAVPTKIPGEKLLPSAVPTKIPGGTMKINLHKDSGLDPALGETFTKLEVGETVTAVIRYNPAGESISGADAVIRFDPALLTVVTPVKTDFGFANYPRKTIDNQKGLVKITGYVVNCDPCSGIIAAITFQAASKGNTTLEMDFAPGVTNKSTIAQKGTGINILGRVEGATLVISNLPN